MQIEDIDFKKGGGLIPVVVQDYLSKDVLMLGYANREALEMTAKTGFAHFYSRSRKKLWKKGETSGNTQEVKEIYVDCDEDSIIYVVKANGPACHTGNRSCFYRRLDI